MDANTLIVLSLVIAACGVLALALPLLKRWRLQRGAARTLDSALARQRAEAHGAAASASASAPGVQADAGRKDGAALSAKLGARVGNRLLERFNQRWLESPLGRAVVTAEEQALLEQCGFYGVRARAVFGALRLLLPTVAAVLAFLWRLPQDGLSAVVWAFAAFAALYLGSKAALRRRAAQRLLQLEEELPVLVDILRLLQGVGLSIDQSLQVIVSEFGSMLHVLGPELNRANQQFASGRSREQTLQRIGRLFDSEDLRNLIMLLSQVDRFGGAVQEPLRLFGLRLQETRKANLKDKIGRLTVKMTAVMVVTLLPVLLILTAGPGFLGVIRMMSKVGGT
ncbi:type II secretion system F family protein [Cupriavidus malaysiensis]|uniref:Pilus assembly protein TadC n=1 Tax=Cupriavidus malaysiensis TaxID=367825 RepID=A0ABM6FA27_9BURK|nr:type II secretion system F family protein [Cupriavidus malaysiensis]AOZ08447.1 pilus assembly protein TadC [Cupriavidus malaysiensis]